MELYIDPASPPFDALGSFTVGKIKRLSWVTKKDAPENSVDFYMNIYTMPYEGGDASWYGNRLTLEPMYSHNLNAPANQWNVWSTDPGTNQLTVFDSNHAPYGWYYPPTLADIQAGPINWNEWTPYGEVTNIDYASQTVKYILLATGTAWCDTFVGYLDAITIELTTGVSVTIDLEDYPSQV